MSLRANPVRDEAQIAGVLLRPTYAALVAAESELGSLFALVERVAEGRLTLHEGVTLAWACRVEPVAFADRDAFAEAVRAEGLAALSRALAPLVAAIVRGG